MNRSPDYVFVFLEIFSGEGGIQSYVKDVLSAYLGLPGDYSAEVFLLRDAPGCDNPFEGKNLVFHYLKTPNPSLGRWKLIVALVNCLILRRPKKVFCGHINLAPVVSLFCTSLGIPYIVMTYGKDVWKPLSKLQRQALQKAQGIWTISRYSRNCLCETNGVDSDAVEIVPCIVDGDRFTPAPKSPSLLKKYGLENSVVIVTVARLWSGDIYKGVDVTIRALPRILSIMPDVKYLVIGRGDDQPRLAQLAAQLGVENEVIFAGFVPTEDLVHHYRLADAYVMPSQEGFGIVYLEAMACGVPVLSGDADGSADPLQDGRTGWRVPHRDPAAVAEAVVEMLGKQDQRCQGQWLREQTLGAFGKSALISKLESLLV
ncbi:MAG: D-inositol-3-phosphate glycosyltransferase [Chroococcopsis gigantea SAG 12.99]|jgi:glycosyltransferase involved in cell wall biosynthesis|nr:glycosyltransferase [Chlorogloea purpurea SAG 13.99]MDV2998934.1 D-inositol-3-phosphate glycosyltransferase [Chroococcopsis gigantea SAG 12.99]